MARLLFICGHAGSGKTTLAKRLIGALSKATGECFCLLDKDTLYGGYSAAVMKALTGDPNDRDSPIYLQNLRDPEYRSLLDTARENLSSGVDVIVVGPLSREIKAHLLIDRGWLGVPANTRISIVWVEIAEAEARRRIEARGNPNDAYKLAHWEEYAIRRFVPDRAAYPELIVFDGADRDPAEFERLARLLLI